MTFEEFFHKKKIDLVQLQEAETALFFEFKSHFEVMGAKSFDHSKKFWFNKLRRLYHIVEEPRAEKTKIEINQIASQTEPLNSPVPESKTGFTPRFKAKPTVAEEVIPLGQKAQELKDQTSVELTFKPRFKPQVTSLKIENDSINEVAKSEKAKSDELQEVVPSQPTFKPRYKPQLAKPVSEVEPIKTDEEKEGKKGGNLEESKPVSFKPRFKANITKSATETPQNPEVKPVEIKQELNSEETPKLGFKPSSIAGITTPKSESFETKELTKSEEKTIEESAPKLGFKPRFKAGVTGPKTEVPETKEVLNPTDNTTEEEPASKLGFKPRFKAGDTKATVDESKFTETEKNSISIEQTETFAKQVSDLQVEDKNRTQKADSESNLEDISEAAEQPLNLQATKLGFKPRFKAQATKQNPPAENPE